MKGVTPFDSVLVTSDQSRRFERQVQQLLDDTLREFDTHVSLCENNKNPLHDKWQWKPLKTREGLSVFKERQPTHPELNPLATKTSADSSSSATDRPTTAVAMAAYTPEMAMVMSNAAAPGSFSVASTVVTGHVNGSLSDVMYGLLAVDTADLQLQLRYMTDVELLDSTMLSCIRSPTATDPFRFVGLQWVVRGEASRVKASGKRPRDFVLLVASGVVQHKSKEIGYYLCQSVEIQECGELELQGLTRGWLSTCSLFTQVQDSSQVNVFSRGFADFKGKLQDYQAANLMTTLVLNRLADAAACGQSKKLNWLLHFKGAAAEFRRLHPQSASSASRCGICERKFGVLHSVAACNLCQVNMCSRCRVSRELSFVKRRDPVPNGLNWEEGQAGGQVRCMAVVLCKNCKMNANHMDAMAMACREVQASYGAQEMARTAPVTLQAPVQARSSEKSHSSETKMRFWTPGTDTAKQPTLVAWTPGTDDKKEVVKPKVMIGRMDSGRSKLESSVSSFASTLPSPRDRDSQEDSSFELTPYQPQYVREDSEISYSYAGNNGGQADLVRRMQELQMKSESVYKFTSQMNANTRFRHQQFDASTSISELD